MTSTVSLHGTVQADSSLLPGSSFCGSVRGLGYLLAHHPNVDAENQTKCLASAMSLTSKDVRISIRSRLRPSHQFQERNVACPELQERTS